MTYATTAALAGALDRSRPAHRRLLRGRLRTLLGALTGNAPSERAATADLLAALGDHVTAGGDDVIWLSLAVLTAELPEETDVRRVRRAVVLDGVATAYSDVVAPGGVRRFSSGGHAVVEVAVGEVVVDVEHTARTHLATGIQRVARESARRWHRDHDVRLVGWTSGHRALRALRRGEREQALTGTSRVTGPEPEPVVVVPWRCTYVLPELAPERDRTSRLSALAQYSGSRTSVIGFDCIPITSSETTDGNVSEAFAGYLSAVRHFDQVVGISEAAATEYRGWAHMLTAIGRSGPQVSALLLPAETGPSSEDDLGAARARFVVGTMPMVLCVGTHEPRKNHLAVLAAAEALWEDGVRFSLSFVGGHSWASGGFDARLRDLQEAGRPVESVSGIDDGLLWAAYRIAHCVVFPSLNEGFGLPVAEALSVGTPALTSDLGSMREIAADGGALLVDPHDDRSIAEGLRTLLLDDAEHAALREAAAARAPRTWDDYASELWDRLVTTGP